jgi:glycosyltransferase involved in cell wall biosynthesis
MKIVHLSSVRTANDIAVFGRACRVLASAGHEVSYAVPASVDHVAENIRILAIRKPGRPRLQRMLFTTWSAYRRAARVPADLFFVHDPEMLPVALVLRMRGARVVYYAHEDAPRDVMSRYYLPMPFRPVVARFVEAVEHLVCPRLTALVAATDTIATRMRSLHPQVITVRNYPRLDVLEGPAVRWMERPHTIVYLGGISLVRGIREILEALALLPEGSPARLVLAGQFSPPSLAAEMMRHPGWRRVEWLGHIDPARIPQLLLRARAGLVVYHPEANHVTAEPYKLFECMAAGIPLIASDFSHWRTIISSARCGILVDPRNPVEISQAIDTLVADTELAEQLGAHGRRFARDRCDGDRETAKLLELCERIVRLPERRCRLEQE